MKPMHGDQPVVSEPLEALAGVEHSRVVLVHSQRIIRAMQTRQLNGLQPRVEFVQFHASDEAFDYMLGHGAAVDLAVAELHNENLDGMELARRMRASRSTAGIPLILIAPASSLPLKLRALEFGATEFLTSPLDPVEFRARARNLIQVSFTKRADGAQRIEESSRLSGGSLNKEDFAAVVAGIQALLKGLTHPG